MQIVARKKVAKSRRPASADAVVPDTLESLATQLWQRAADGDLEARDTLLVEHLNLVHHTARQLSRRIAVQVDYDELVSAGTIGLMAALGSFDVSRGLAFSTFAIPRIRGAILDELRRQDHVPRSIRRKTRDISQAREQIMRAEGRAPEDAEIAAHLSIDLETLWRWQGEIEGAVHLPLDRTASDNDNSPAPADFLTASDEVGIDDLIGREQEVGLLRDAIMALNEQESTVLALYYFEELKLQEIGDILGITESRVSQIRAKALGRLRLTLAPLRT
jgi:RNA polymerase sigma factor for flagellar operon FliA